MDCPNGHGPMTQLGKFLFCGECGYKIPFQVGAKNGVARGQCLVNLIPKLPSTIALVLDEYIRESSDYRTLHRMCGALEITTRFLTIVVLADVWERLSSHNKDFPDSLIKELLQNFERPTLGSWRELLEKTINALPGKKIKECILPELPEYARRFVALLGGGGGDPLKKLLPMRNELAHGGRISDDRVKEFLHAHTANFESLMSDLEFLSEDSGVTLVASPAEGAARILQGVSPGGAEFDRSKLPFGFQQSGPDRMLLVMPRGVLDMFPLHAYGEVFRIEKDQPVGQGQEAIHIYSRTTSQTGVEYSALGSRDSNSRGNPSWFDRFAEIFRLEEWRKRYRITGALARYTFDRRMDDLLRLFIGRDKQIEEAVAHIKALDSGILWLSGKPGMGKSAFMAKLIRDYFQKGSEGKSVTEVICIPYFFKASDGDLCRPYSFAEAAILHFAQASGKDVRIENDPKERMEQFKNLLADTAKAESERQGRKILFFVDGMDEIASVDAGFIDTIFNCQHPGVVWICAGRDEDILCKKFTRDKCKWFFDDEALLPPLNENGVRGFFIEELGHKLPQFFGRDRQDGDKWSNDFVKKVMDRSDGLPLYLRLLVEDIRNGNMDFSESSESRLPRDLYAYYDRLIDEMGDDISSTVPAIASLLALAMEPMAFEMLFTLLADHDTVGQPVVGSEFLEKALRHSNIMLHRAPTATGALGYELYHTSFRQHLRNSERVKLNRNKALERLCKLVVNWQNYEAGSLQRDYALKFGTYHLCHQLRVYSKIRIGEECKQKLYKLINNEFLDEKLKIVKHISFVLSDIKLVLRLALKDDDLPKIVRFGEMYVSYKENARKDLAQVPYWVKSSEENRALELVALINDDTRRYMGWVFIAYLGVIEKNKELINAALEKIKRDKDGVKWKNAGTWLLHWFVPDLLRAKAVNEAIAIAESIDDEYFHDECLTSIAMHLAGEEQLELSLETANKIKSTELRDRALAWIARRFAEKGKYEISIDVLGKITVDLERRRAIHLIAESTEHLKDKSVIQRWLAKLTLAADRIEDNSQRSVALSSVAMAHAWINDRYNLHACQRLFEFSIAIAWQINSYNRGETLADICTRLVRAGRHEDALQLANTLENEERSKELESIAGVLAQKGEYSLALRVADNMGENMYLCRILAWVALCYAKGGNKGEAQKMFTQSINMARKLNKTGNKQGSAIALRFIAVQLAEIGEYARALKVADMINDYLLSSLAYSEIAECLAKDRQYERALEISKKAHYWDRSSTLYNIGKVIAEEEDRNRRKKIIGELMGEAEENMVRNIDAAYRDEKSPVTEEDHLITGMASAAKELVTVGREDEAYSIFTHYLGIRASKYWDDITRDKKLSALFDTLVSCVDYSRSLDIIENSIDARKYVQSERLALIAHSALEAGDEKSAEQLLIRSFEESIPDIPEVTARSLGRIARNEPIRQAIERRINLTDKPYHYWREYEFDKLVIILDQMGNREMAEHALNISLEGAKAIEDVGIRSKALIIVAKSFLRIGNRDMAEYALNISLEGAKAKNTIMSIDSMIDLGVTFVSIGKYNQALEAANRIGINFVKDKFELLGYIANCMYRTGDKDNGWILFQKALELAHNKIQGDYWINLGIEIIAKYMAQAGEYEWAFKVLEETKRDHGFISLSEYFADIGNFELCLDALCKIDSESRRNQIASRLAPLFAQFDENYERLMKITADNVKRKKMLAVMAKALERSSKMANRTNNYVDISFKSIDMLNDVKKSSEALRDIANRFSSAGLKAGFRKLIPIAVENNADWAETLAEMVKLYKDPNDIWDALKEMGVNPIDKTN